VPRSILVFVVLLVPLLAGIFPLPTRAQEGLTGPLPARTDGEADREIAAGLSERFAQIPGLAGVSVTVRAGVVRLGGETPTPTARESAVAVARRVTGAVEVIDEIRVTRDLAQRLRPVLGKLEGRACEAVAWVPVLALALVVFGLFWWLAGVLSRRQRFFARLSPNRFVQDLLAQVFRLATILVGALLALEILEITALVGAVLGAAGVVGLAVGFAFRDMAENYIASVLLSLRQPFSPNDFVDIDGRSGKVLRLTSRATVLMTLEGNHLRIPNAQVFKGAILNYSRNPLRQFDFALGVGNGEDLGEVRRRGLEVLAATPGVLEDPGPSGLITGLGDFAVQLCFYAWVDQRKTSWVMVKSEAIRRIKEAFDAAGIDLPEPTWRLHLQGGLPEVVPRPSPARPAPAQPSPAQPSPAQPSPAQPAPSFAAHPLVVEERPSPPSPDGLAAGDAIDRQMAAERAVSGEEDLLDPAGRQE